MEKMMYKIIKPVLKETNIHMSLSPQKIIKMNIIPCRKIQQCTLYRN